MATEHVDLLTLPIGTRVEAMEDIPVPNVRHEVISAGTQMTIQHFEPTDTTETVRMEFDNGDWWWLGAVQPVRVIAKDAQ